MRGGRGLVRGGEPATAQRFDVASASCRLHVCSPKTRRCDVARRALLQKQFSRLDDRLGMKPRPHRAVQHGVGNGHNRHALMMRHEGVDYRDAFALRKARRRVVQSLVEPVGALRADLSQTLQIGDRRPRIDHRSQSGCVGRYDSVFTKAALQPKARNPEIGVLIGQFQIARVIGGFGYAPGQREFCGVGDLPAHGQSVRLLKQAARRGSHHERGHQIFKHGSRPGDQGGAARDRSGGAAQAEPVLRGNVAFGNCKEAGQTRLGSQEIVTVLIERAFVEEISDRQQLPVVIEEETELHRERHRARRAFENNQPFTLPASTTCARS